ncbi:DsbA family protein [Aureimonas populi]|uniref:DsbA family protein n=1 Tax=Aureimonas populi TaxID=1701758 RepID=A0ABW5CNB5_9HYPH|nr:DsbA family protein [Aureimonas populi]
MPRPHRLSHLLLASAITLAGVAPAAAFTPEETGQIEGIVRDYLIRNPQVLLEALDALEEQRAGEMQDQQREAIAQAQGELTATPPGTALGNPEGDVTIVEFFDYNCGFCRRSHADMTTLIENDPELRFVLKEIPVLGPESEQAARVSLAVRHIAPDRYPDFHDGLLTTEGVADESTALAVASDLGLEEDAVREAMDDPAVLGALQESARLATMLQITGTPSYVIGDELVPGAVGAEALAARVANVRECGRATC